MKEATQARTEQNFWEDLRSSKFAKMIKEEARGQLLNGPHEVFHIVKPIFAENDDVERLYCIFLDTRKPTRLPAPEAQPMAGRWRTGRARPGWVQL